MRRMRDARVTGREVLRIVGRGDNLRTLIETLGHLREISL